MEEKIHKYLKLAEKWEDKEDTIRVRGNKDHGVFMYENFIASEIVEIDFEFCGEDDVVFTAKNAFELFFRKGKTMLFFPEEKKLYGLNVKDFDSIRKMRMYLRTERESMLIYIDAEMGIAPIIEWNLDCPYFKESTKSEEWVSNLYLALTHGNDKTLKAQRREETDEAR